MLIRGISFPPGSPGDLMVFRGEIWVKFMWYNVVEHGNVGKCDKIWWGCSRAYSLLMCKKSQMHTTPECQSQVVSPSNLIYEYVQHRRKFRENIVMSEVNFPESGRNMPNWQSLCDSASSRHSTDSQRPPKRSHTARIVPDHYRSSTPWEHYRIHRSYKHLGVCRGHFRNFRLGHVKAVIAYGYTPWTFSSKKCVWDIGILFLLTRHITRLTMLSQDITTVCPSWIAW